jgi:hypothetical protein
VIRIGIAQPKAQMGRPNTAEPIRSIISQYLTGPSQEIVPMSAMVSSQIEAEAKVKECDYVLHSVITQKTGGGAPSFLKNAGPLAGMIPMVGMAGGAAGAVGGAIAGTAVASAAGVASTIKAKSEVTFDFKLMASGIAMPVLANMETAKAKADGEDIISPLIEHAATAILAEIAKHK